MDYIQFKNNFQNTPFILGREVVSLEKGKQNTLNQLTRWQDKGLIVKLRKGIYLLNKNDRKINPNQVFIANHLYEPSYVSLEYALSLYGLIPEKVTWLTSVTTRKTARFSNELGTFIYQQVKPQAFGGFRSIKDKSGFSIFIAEPEKAVVDFLYLNLSKFQPRDRDIFRESYRFQNLEKIKQKRIINLTKSYSNRKLLRIAKSFCEFVKEEARA